MDKHIYTVYIGYRGGLEESRMDLNICHDYEESCQAAERTLEFNSHVKAVSVKNELGVTVFYKDRDVKFLETDVLRVSEEEIKDFLSNPNQEAARMKDMA